MSLLQITSHTLAAAIGFAIVIEVIHSGESVIDVSKSRASMVSIVFFLSVGFALAAGKSEASGLMKRGI